MENTKSKQLINIEKTFLDSIAVKKKILLEGNLKKIEEIGEICTNSILAGKKIMFCGNGGSAADAQHLAAELLVRLKPENNRQAIPAICLAQDSSTLTACANDFGYDFVFERTLRAIGSKGDVLIAISTSGKSKNIVRVIRAANQVGIYSFAFLGNDGGDIIDLCDNHFLVPDKITGRIQEAHITAGHALMEYIEDSLIEKDYINIT